MPNPAKRKSSVSGDGSLLDLSRRKAVPFAFVLEELASLSPWTRPMFGCLAVYVGESIVLALRDKPDSVEDNGVWLATSREHHDSLRLEFPSMRSIQVLGGGDVTNWQILPVEVEDFEAAALRACELIRAADPRIGRIPKPRRVSKAGGKTRTGRRS